MTSPDEHTTTPTDPFTSGATAQRVSLSRLLETWQAWSGREVFTRAAAQARAAGEQERAQRLREIAGDPEVAALDALAAQHEMADLMAGWEWHTVRAAREQGATWADIAYATRTRPEQARTAYLKQVQRQEHAAASGGVPFDDAHEYRAAAGHWFAELHLDTPDHVVEQIEGAIVRDDIDELAALRSAWWNPAHVPPVTVFDAPTDAELDRAAQARAAAERGNHAEARRLSGFDDAALAAAVAEAAAGPLHVDIAPGLAVPVSDQPDGYRNHTVDEAVTALAPLLGSRTAAERAVGEHLAARYPQMGPTPYGRVFEDADLVAIAYPARVDPWASTVDADRVLHTHSAVSNRGLLGVGIDATDAEAIEAAQDAADRAFQAEIEDEVAEADALDGPDPYEHLGQVRVPGPAELDDPWRTPGPPVPDVELTADDGVSGNDLAGDVERVLAHLRVQNTAHQRWAGPLWDMPPERWEASIAVLRAGGYDIATATATHDDTAANSTAYWVDTGPERDLPNLNDDLAQAQHGSGTDRAEQGGGWWAQARSTDPDVAPVTFDGSGFYSDADIAAIGDALDAGDSERAQALQDRPWLAQGATVDTARFQVTDDRPAHGDDRVLPVMPEWMREQARRTEAEIAAGTYMPGPVDDPARIAARLAELREQAAARDPGPSTVRDGDQPAHTVRSCLVEIDVQEQEVRREQLTRWHTDDTDTATDGDTAGDSAGDVDHDGDQDGAGVGDRVILVDGTEQR